MSISFFQNNKWLFKSVLMPRHCGATNIVALFFVLVAICVHSQNQFNESDSGHDGVPSSINTLSIGPATTIPTFGTHKAGIGVEITLAFHQTGDAASTETTLEVTSPLGYTFTLDCFSGAKQPSGVRNIQIGTGRSGIYTVTPIRASDYLSCKGGVSKATVTFKAALKGSGRQGMHSFTIEVLSSPSVVPTPNLWEITYAQSSNQLNGYALSKVYGFSANCPSTITGQLGIPAKGDHVVPNMRPIEFVGGINGMAEFYLSVTTPLKVNNSLLLLYPKGGFRYNSAKKCTDAQIGLSVYKCGPGTAPCAIVDFADISNYNKKTSVVCSTTSNLTLMFKIHTTKGEIESGAGIYIRMRVYSAPHSVDRQFTAKFYTCSTYYCPIPVNYDTSPIHLDFGETNLVTINHAKTPESLMAFGVALLFWYI
eukprot:Platyproteum_vivax@DN3698_c0_g1_i1.p1